jgi:hypothetical protein
MITPCSWVLLVKPLVAQLLKNFSKFYGIRRFITVFTKVRHWSLSWVRWIQSIPPHPFPLRPIMIVYIICGDKMDPPKTNERQKQLHKLVSDNRHGKEICNILSMHRNLRDTIRCCTPRKTVFITMYSEYDCQVRTYATFSSLSGFCLEG